MLLHVGDGLGPDGVDQHPQAHDLLGALHSGRRCVREVGEAVLLDHTLRREPVRRRLNVCALLQEGPPAARNVQGGVAGNEECVRGQAGEVGLDNEEMTVLEHGSS